MLGRVGVSPSIRSEPFVTLRQASMKPIARRRPGGYNLWVHAGETASDLKCGTRARGVAVGFFGLFGII
jgi:hypothetical protein